MYSPNRPMRYSDCNEKVHKETNRMNELSKEELYNKWKETWCFIDNGDCSIGDCGDVIYSMLEFAVEALKEDLESGKKINEKYLKGE